MQKLVSWFGAAFVLASMGCGSPQAPAAPVAPAASDASPVRRPTAAVVHVEGERIVGPDGQPLELRGMSFGNRVWLDDRMPRVHHDERDFERLAALGMNAVRFYVNYRTLESDEAPGQWLADGWQWLDDNVAWAKRHGVYLVLNLHVPPGGFQSLGKGKALWTDPKMQARFLTVWRAIAERYATEPTIAGLDLLNEPVVENGPDDWKSLAERAIETIREVDPNHAIFVERFNAIRGDWSENQDRNFIRVSDPNVVYEFHFYKPFHFTHQSAQWVDFAAEKQRYPDEKVAEAEWFLTEYATGTFNSPKLPPGDSDWRYYEGLAFQVTNPRLVIGKPSLACQRAGAGKAYFDDIVLERLDKAGKSVETLYRVNLETTRGWYFWEKTPRGARALEKQGHGDQSSLSITGTVDDANLGADFLRFQPKQGETYRLSGWMKGERIPADASCKIRLDFSSSSVPVHSRGKAFLAQELEAYLAWGRREKVPLFLGEFGAIRFAFEDDRGGDRWTEDMLDLLLEKKLSFTYHDYHEDHFGLFLGEGSLPEEAQLNRPLYEVFRRKLAKKP
ncbi:MAG TPA: glycoside hydrolase family 5 protein [Polyangiaceae bacterium]